MAQPRVVCERRGPGEFRLCGRINLSCVGDLRLLLHDAVDDAAQWAANWPASRSGGRLTEVRIDVSGLEFADTAGLGALLSTHRRAQRQGLSLVLAGVAEPLARLLFLSRLYRVIRVERLPVESLASRLPAQRTSVAVAQVVLPA